MGTKTKNIFESEEQVEQFVTQHLEEKWELRCRRQMRVNGKIPDILAYSDKSDCIIAIEVKLRDWKRCLSQAFTNKNISDFSFICMPSPIHTKIRTKIRDELNKTGVGFLEFDLNKLDVSIKKTPNKNMLKEKRKQMLLSEILWEETEDEHLL